MADKNDIVIVDAVRTAVGNFNGGLAGLSADKLGAEVVKALLARNKLAAADVNELILGQVLTAAVGQNPARQTAIHAGLAQESTAITINQVCGSGLRAVAEAARDGAWGRRHGAPRRVEYRHAKPRHAGNEAGVEADPPLRARRGERRGHGRVHAAGAPGAGIVGGDLLPDHGQEAVQNRVGQAEQ